MEKVTSRQTIETNNLSISIKETQEDLKLSSEYKTRIKVGDFEIQKSSGNYARNETTLWVKSIHRWLTLKQIEDLVKGDIQ